MLVAAEPFRLAPGDTHFVTFLKTVGLDAATKRALEDLSNDFDTLVVQGADVHWRMRGKSTDTLVPKRGVGEGAGRALEHEPQHDHAPEARRVARRLSRAVAVS